MSFTVQMQIDETGAIQDAEVIRGKASNKCQKTLVDFVEHAKYMPAIHQGASVAVKYVDFWFRSSDRWTGREVVLVRLFECKRLLVACRIRQIFFPHGFVLDWREFFENDAPNMILRNQYLVVGDFRQRPGIL